MSWCVIQIVSDRSLGFGREKGRVSIVNYAQTFLNEGILPKEKDFARASETLSQLWEMNSSHSSPH